MSTATVSVNGTLMGLAAYNKMLPVAALAAMKSTARFASLFVTKYLHGPRPLYLQSRSNTLRTHIGYAAERVGREIRGHIGTNAKSKKGFNYPEYWEQGILNPNRRGLRKFLAPAVTRNQRAIAAMYRNQLQNEINNRVTKGGTK